MKNIFFIVFYFLFISINAQTSIFNNLLKKHVDNQGNVDYKSFKKDIKKLQEFTYYLNSTSPNNYWSRDKQKAFWINTYNAYTILLILYEYPLKSITEIKIKEKNAWNIPFVKVGGETYTLDYVEHQILRKKLFDPRIHVGVNCASTSCPKLLNKAFTETNVNNELEKLMIAFINDSKRNKLDKKSVIYISEIFNWFKEDFTKKGSIIDYINKYTIDKVSTNAKIRYLPYNWNLNRK